MKKIYLLLATALLCASSLFAADPAIGEKVADNAFPYQRYLTGFYFNRSTQVLTFTDNYQQGTHSVRDYYVYAIQRIEGNGFYVGGYWNITQQKYVADAFLYGDAKYYAFYNQTKRVSGGNLNTTNQTTGGGKVEVPAAYMRNLIAQCAAAGFSKVRIVVEPVIRTNTQISYYATEDQTSPLANKWYANFYDVDLPTISCTADNEKLTVDFGKSFKLDAKVFGLGEMQFIWQKNKSIGANDWYDLSHETLASDWVKAGLTLSYDGTFNKNSMRPCNYRLLTYVPSTGDRDTCVFTVNFRYPVTFPNGIVQYYKAGDEVVYGKGTVCTDYVINGRFVPKIDYSNKSYISFEMMPCALTIKEVTAKYWVEFFGNEGQELKSELVECGNDATPPTPPTIEGLEFVRWSGDYTNVRSALKLKAIYAISGEALELKLKEHKTYQNDGWTFNSLSHDYFQKSATRAMSNDSLALNITIRSNAAANAWICTGTLTTGKDEIVWNDGGYQKAISAEEAKSGKLLEWTMPVAHTTWGCANGECPKSNENWFVVKEAYRVKVTSGGTTVYSNPIVFDVYYPLNFKSEHELYVKNEEFFTVGKEGVIPVRAGEKVYIRDNEVTADCALTLSGTDQNLNSTNQGTDEDGTWYIPSGQTDQMTVAPRTYDVIFKAVNPTTHQTMFTDKQAVACGTAAVEPEVPAVEGFAFMGWESDDETSYASDAYKEVVSDNDGFPMQFNAKWQKLIPDYTVTWLDKDGQEIKKETVEEGKAATPPAAPAVDGYTFTGWDNDYSVITSDISITAQYSKNDVYWTVTYKYINAQYEEVVIGSEQVKDGCPAAQNIEAPVMENMTFTGWSQDLSNVQSDMTVIAQYKVTTFHITFLDWDGTKLSEDDVIIGMTPTKPADPTREPTQDKQYKFAGWSPEVVDAAADAVYTAQYNEEPREFIVRFIVGDDEWFAFGSVQYGKSAAWIIEGKKIPAPEGYHFAGWDKDFDNIICELNVNAIFEKGQMFTVTATVNDAQGGTVSGGGEYLEGTEIQLTATPAEGYEFKQWSNGSTDNPLTLTVTEDIELTAEFHKIGEGIEAIEQGTKNKEQGPQKVLRDGHVYIIMPDGREYNAAGAMVK